MSAQDFLVELGTEELPPKALNTLAEAFLAGIEKGLQAAGLNYASKSVYAAPRRLAVLIRQLDVQQPDRSINIDGPPLQAAFNAEGQPTQAALGFAKKCGVELAEIDQSGPKLRFSQHIPGKATTDLLPTIVEDSLNDLPIPKRMRWGARKEEFVRPTQWLVMLLGDQVIDCTLLAQKAGRDSRGHRFHHPESVRIGSPSSYLADLRAAYVLADANERREIISKRTEELATRQEGTAIVPANLLDLPRARAYLQGEALDAMQERIRASDNPLIAVWNRSTAGLAATPEQLARAAEQVEAVAEALTNVFAIPPENLATQGYGEQYLKVNTDAPEEENRRATIRRITPLLQGAQVLLQLRNHPRHDRRRQVQRTGCRGKAAFVGHAQHQGELVAAQAAGQLDRAGGAAHFLGHGAQGGVAGQVAAAVVDGLEVVDVHQQQGQAQACQGLAAQFVEVAVQAAAVGQAGQVVGAHQLLGDGEFGAGLAQGVQRLHQVFVAALEVLDQLVLAGDQVGEAALHEAGDVGRLALDQGLEGLLGDLVKHAGGFGDGAREALVAADEHRQLAEVLAGAEQLVGQAVVEAEPHFAGINKEHALRRLAAPEELLAGQHGPTDPGAGKDAEFFG